MINRQNSASTVSRINNPTDSRNDDKPNSDKSSALTPSSSKLMSLQDEKNVLGKRKNSLISMELMMNNSSEGGRECVALATVFGVPEYIDSKVFWERQQKQTHPLRPPSSDKYGYVSVNSISISSRPITSAFKEDNDTISQNLQSKLFISSYVDSMLGHVGLSVNPSLIGTSTDSPRPRLRPAKSFSLPHIPNVSTFNDLLIDEENEIDTMLPANYPSVLLHSSTPTIRADTQSPSVHSGNILPPVIDTEDIQSLKPHIAVLVGPSEVFDLLLSDEDERFIIWGPDPISLSSSMATTSTERPSSYATLYNSQHRRPELQGFSSNATSGVMGTRSLRWSEKLLRDSDHGSLLLKKAFGLSKKKEKEKFDIHLSNVPKVIEAATVHKLIEKLTNTLDYTLMTDFFLTYRDFLKSQELCQLLISRFYWALENDDESRKIVRIRTFVVLRHWLNNYFVHDFIGDRELRVILTNFLNQLPSHPLIKNSPRDQRIVKILKRVVRRLKKLYYNQSSGASRVKVILPPPPTAEQEQMSEIIRARISSSSGIRRKSGRHHGNLAVQDARNATVVVVGSLAIKAASLIDSNLDQSSSIHQKRQAGSVASDDSLESDLSAGDSLPNDSYISDEFSPPAAEDWVKEQQETLEYFKLANMDSVDTRPKVPRDLSDLTSDFSSPPATPNNSGIKDHPISISSKDTHRVPSERWCKSDDETQTKQPIALPSEAQSPVGLSKKPSQKSIERRKSERNLEESNVSSSITSPPLSPPIMPTTKPRSLRSNKTNKENKEPVIEKFAAIPYRSAQVVGIPVTSSSTPTKHRVARVLSKVFAKSQVEAEKTRVDSTPLTAPPPPVAEETPKDVQPPNSSHLASLTAQRPRYESMDSALCECTSCSGFDSTIPCRRRSVLILDQVEQRQKQQDGSVYLGHLQARSVANNKKQIDDDNHSQQSEKSMLTEAQVSSSRARMSFVSDLSQQTMPRSKLIELGIPHKRPMSIHHSPRKSDNRCFIMSYRTSRLAKQFCFIERDVLSKVGWEELIHCKWTKMDACGNVTAYVEEKEMTIEPINYTLEMEKRRHEEQGIEQVIQRFNMVCQWVSFEIVRTKNINERVKLIEKFIRLAKKCQMFSNYATLVQILLGLQSPAVAHLEKTWSKVSPKCQRQLNKLTEFTSPMKNWKNIRDSMTEVAEEYGNSPSEVQVELPGTSSPNTFKKATKIKMPFGGCIPFLGIYLSDLVFNSEKPRYLRPTLEHQRIYMANSTRNLPACLDEPLVNFRKHRVIATVIKRVLTFQNLATRYAFEEDPVLIEKCKYLQVMDAAKIRELSASLE